MKRVSLIVIMLFISFATEAQVKVRFGIRAGWNSANISNTDGRYTNSFYGGVHAVIRFSEKYTLQPELNLTYQNVNLFYPIEDFDDKTKIWLHGGSIINKFYLTKKFHLMVGPFFGIKLYENWYENFNDDEDYYDDPEDLLQYFDTGIVVGIGYNIIPNLLIEARFKQGFVDMYEWWYDGETNDSHLNQTFQLGLSYKFDF